MNKLLEDLFKAVPPDEAKRRFVNSIPDWHCYNLMRKIESEDQVTDEIIRWLPDRKQRLKAARESGNEDAEMDLEMEFYYEAEGILADETKKEPGDFIGYYLSKAAGGQGKYFDKKDVVNKDWQIYKILWIALPIGSSRSIMVRETSCWGFPAGPNQIYCYFA